MLISNHISTNKHEVKLTDSITYVLDKMHDQHCEYLAVVENDTYLGLIDEISLLDEYDTELPIQNLQNQLKNIYLFDYQHIYDALELVSQQELCFVPILNKNLQYVGSLSKHDILVAINSILGNEDSVIIILELGIRDNSLSHIARIIESENTTIYSSAIRQIPDTSQLEMTLKVNKTNISAVIAALWRNDYIVKATFRDTPDNSDIQNRYELLMNYLDM